MKKIIALLFLLLAIGKSIYAQDTTSITGKMQFVFAQLNRNDISTGFLEERGFPLVSLKPFNGILTDSNKVNLNTLRATYFALYSSCMLATNPMLPIDTLNNRINQYLPVQNAVPIAMHFDNFNSFKLDAVSNSLLTVDGDDVIHDVANRTVNPYLLKNLFTASPIKDIFENGNFSFIFKPNLFLTNSGLTISSLYIDFDDGQGYQTASWNVENQPNYSEAGEKTIKIKIILSNNSQYECYTTITVKQITALQRFNPNLPSLVQTFYANSNNSGGRAIVRYITSNTTGHLKKPLIVVEGYDATSIAPNLAGDNFTYSNFINSLEDVLILGYDFNYQLDDVAGYDLVFIDYNNGTDDIVRNANLFKSVLAWVNKEKALGGSSQQNVVMGISMGGLVARYALADLTKNNIATQTRLLITHDSPHQGANVPVCLQRVVLAVGELNMFGKKITDVFPDYSETTTVLNAPATSQLLTYRVANHDGPLILNSWLNATYKPMVTFQSTDPVPSYRFIATSQGSECGTPLFAPGTQLLNVQGSGAALYNISTWLIWKIRSRYTSTCITCFG